MEAAGAPPPPWLDDNSALWLLAVILSHMSIFIDGAWVGGFLAMALDFVSMAMALEVGTARSSNETVCQSR
jgi:hypothetical protein